MVAMSAAFPAAPAASELLVVDDHDLVRLGLRTLVQAHKPPHGTALTVWEARTLDEAIGLYRAHGARIGLVMLDLHLPDTQGLSGLTRFLADFPRASVAVLSGDNDPLQMQQAMAQGAKAYLLKSGDLQHVITYIRSVGLFGPLAWNQQPGAVQATAASATGLQPALTDRQQQVLAGVIAGRSNREIAEAEHLSEGTVKNHVSALLLHFGVRSRAQLISTFR